MAGVSIIMQCGWAVCLSGSVDGQCAYHNAVWMGMASVPIIMQCGWTWLVCLS